MKHTDIFKLTVTEVSGKIRSKEISSVELTRSILEYAEKINPKTNAFISFRKEAALAEAEKADQEIRDGKYRGIYHGIPLAVKDNIYVQDEVTTMGSRIHKDFVPDADAAVISALREAGAILTGKLNLHEYAWGVTNDNPHFGPAHNPWNPDKITGGSSGGSAAAIASGASFASVGTDTAGSVRIPASCCGIVGLKPTKDLISKAGIFPLSASLDHVGPMGKTVEDVAALLNILVKSAPNASAENYISGLHNDPENITIGINEDYYFHQLDDRVENLVRKQIDFLASEGVTIKPVKIPSLNLVAFIGYMTILSESFTLHDENLKNRLNDFGEDIQGLYKMGIPGAVDYLKAQKSADVLRKEFQAVFTEVDALITPTLPVLPPDIGSPVVSINGQPQDLNDHIMRFMFPGNITGLPSLSLHCGLADGLPVGIQVIGPEYGESQVLRIGKIIQDHVGFDLGKAVDLATA